MVERLRVLLIGDEHGAAARVAAALADASAETAFVVERAASLDEALARLERDGTGAVLLDSTGTTTSRSEGELSRLDRLAAPTDRTAEVTARSFGVQPISRSLPERFAELTGQYGALLDGALERRAYRVDRPLEDALRELAEELAFLRAGPRDVVELHAAALRARIDAASPRRAQAYLEEARLVVLELMGCLVQAYRR
jgi:hypothetical protein